MILTITIVNWRDNPIVPPLLLISTLAPVCSFTGLIFSVYGALVIRQASVQVPGIEQRNDKKIINKLCPTETDSPVGKHIQ